MNPPLIIFNFVSFVHDVNMYRDE